MAPALRDGGLTGLPPDLPETPDRSDSAAGPGPDLNAVLDRAAGLVAGGQAAAGAAILEAVLRHRPALPFAWRNLAIARRAQGDLPGALDAARRATTLAPRQAACHYTLGSILMAAKRFGDAAGAFRQVVALDPAHSEGWNALGFAIAASDAGTAATRTARARAAYLRALACDTGNAGAWNNLGASYFHDHQPGKALDCLRMAATADPSAASHQVNLANALREAGQVGPALRAFDAALRIDPGHPLARSNLIYTLDFDSRQDTASQQQERKAWARQLPRVAPVPAGDRRFDPERPLHIGYVSRDFMIHSAAAAFAATILHRDRTRYRVTCYDSGTPADPATDRFRRAVDAWRPVSGLTDRALAEQVRADAVDILVDLSGHTAGHRLEAFAHRAAPLQVSAWGHGTGTGMPEMDLLFADPVLIPPAERHLFAERVIDLPCAVVFEPLGPTPEAMPQAPAPARRDTEVVFGALGRGVKAGPDCIRLWAQALHATPGSRLYLKDRQYGDRMRIRDIALAFAARGIDGSRLRFDGATDWYGHMAAYWKVDIALDTTPQAGGMTTLEALWMGVPTITLRGRFPSGRASAAILAACGLARWIAEDEAGFAALAARLGAGVQGLRAGRGQMRQTLRGTIPFNGPAYAAAVERVYRALWRERCAAPA